MTKSGKLLSWTSYCVHTCIKTSMNRQEAFWLRLLSLNKLLIISMLDISTISEELKLFNLSTLKLKLDWFKPSERVLKSELKPSVFKSLSFKLSLSSLWEISPIVRFSLTLTTSKHSSPIIKSLHASSREIWMLSNLIWSSTKNSSRLIRTWTWFRDSDILLSSSVLRRSTFPTLRSLLVILLRNSRLSQLKKPSKSLLKPFVMVLLKPFLIMTNNGCAPKRPWTFTPQMILNPFITSVSSFAWTCTMMPSRLLNSLPKRTKETSVILMRKEVPRRRIFLPACSRTLAWTEISEKRKKKSKQNYR